MTDRQRLVYDLALLCAAEEMRRSKKINYLPADMLNEFSTAVDTYNLMNSSAITDALEAIKRVKP